MENFNDDDDERQNSRNMVEALRKRNSVSGTPTLNQSNESDVRSHIQTCIKLYNDNVNLLPLLKFIFNNHSIVENQFEKCLGNKNN